MKNLFRWDNPLIQLLTALADVILTNLLCLICCLPVVTAGASIAATYKVMLNLSQDTGGGIWNTFFTAFRENFKQATAVWLITLLANQSVLIHNLHHPEDKKEPLTQDAVELLTSPFELAEYKEAIMEAMYKGTKRNIESETDSKNVEVG